MPVEAALRKRAVPVERAEEGTLAVAVGPGLRDIGREIRFQVVVAGDFEFFSALLVQAQPVPVLHADDVLQFMASAAETRAKL